MTFGPPSSRRSKGFSRFFAVVALAALMLSTLAPGAGAATRHKKEPKENQKYASFVMDADSGRIISQSNPDKPLHPASLTKIMTLLMVFDALEDGRMSPRDRIEVSKHAASMAPSKLGLDPGETIRVEDAIYAIVTKSANDIAVAVAEALGGSEKDFSRMMTARARAIGMSRTTFVNASGLHNPRQISTARDMAILARYVIHKYPSYYRYFATKSYRYGNTVLRNHNRLMETYDGMDGMKTGYVGPSGFNLVASAVRDGHRLIGVVFGGKTASSRNAEMAKLLDRGFADLDRKKSAGVLVADAGQGASAAAAPIPVRKPQAQPEEKTGFLVSSLTVVKPPEKPAVRTEALALPAGAIGEGAAMGLASTGTPFTGESRDPAFVEKASFSDSVKAAAEKAKPVASVATTRLRPNFRTSPAGSWSIQIGAYASSTATAQILREALGRLPDELSSVRALVSPLKTGAGDMLYRARLSGYARNDAIRACRHFRDCLVIAPSRD